MVYTVQIDILEPCHGDSDKLSLQSGTEYARTCQANVVHASVDRALQIMMERCLLERLTLDFTTLSFPLRVETRCRQKWSKHLYTATYRETRTAAVYNVKWRTD